MTVDSTLYVEHIGRHGFFSYCTVALNQIYVQKFQKKNFLQHLKIMIMMILVKFFL